MCSWIASYVFKFVILILRKEKYILGRIGSLFWGEADLFKGFGKQREILLGNRGNCFQGFGETNALFSGIKGTDPLGGLSVVILQGVGDWIRAC